MQGDETAFEQLLSVYAKSILFRVRNMIQDPGDAEDAAQRIAIEVWKSIHTLKSPYAFSAWLKRICINVCSQVNDRRGRQTERVRPIDEADRFEEERSEYLPHEDLERQEASARMYAYIQRLPQSQRTALLLHYYDGMSFKEIAKALGSAQSTVASNAMKGRRNLYPERSPRARSMPRRCLKQGSP